MDDYLWIDENRLMDALEHSEGLASPSTSIFSETLTWWNYTMALPVPEMAASLFSATLLIAFCVVCALVSWLFWCWMHESTMLSFGKSMKGAREREQ